MVGSKLQPGEVAPDFLLDYLELIEMTIQSTRLVDSTGMVRLLKIVNSLERPVCHRVTRCWEDLSAGLPAGVCLYTVSYVWSVRGIAARFLLTHRVFVGTHFLTGKRCRFT